MNSIRFSTKTIFLLVTALMLAACSWPKALSRTQASPDALVYPPLELKIVEPERIALKNGMALFYLEDRELPLVNLSILVRTGSLFDPEGKEGTADLTAYLLRTGGTEKIASDKLDKLLANLATAPAFSMSLDSASVSFSFLKDDREICFDLLSQMLFAPAFENNKCSLAISLKLEELRRVADNPQRLAFREFNRLLYPDDPRGRYATEASLKKISRDDLVDFHKTFFTPGNMMIALTGDLSREEAVRLVEKYFPRSQQNIKPVAPAPPPVKSGRGVYLVQKTLSQSTVVSGEFVASKSDPDFYAFTVLDFIVGSGGFPSRIFSAVRNNEGLAYSAGSFYRARPDYGVFGTYAFTKTETTLKAIDLIDAILLDVINGSVTQDELAWAKTSILNSFIFSFESPHQIAGRQMLLAYEGMPSDYMKTYRENIHAVTLGDVERVARKYLKNGNRLVLILGDTDRLDPLPDSWGKPIRLSPEE
ncbi:MAG TPA: pitrilysin family protein [Smithellaceae bacterium]|nr:pitrilysin family protein [Smithellaceae bacterium]